MALTMSGAEGREDAIIRASCGGPWLGARMARAVATAPIRLYRVTLSRVLPSVCRFTPSCSAYALEAVERHGVLKGLWLGLKRLLRCNPLSPGGYDPVPRAPGELGPTNEERADG